MGYLAFPPELVSSPLSNRQRLLAGSPWAMAGACDEEEQRWSFSSGLDMDLLCPATCTGAVRCSRMLCRTWLPNPSVTLQKGIFNKTHQPVYRQHCMCAILGLLNEKISNKRDRKQCTAGKAIFIAKQLFGSVWMDIMRYVFCNRLSCWHSNREHHLQCCNLNDRTLYLSVKKEKVLVCWDPCSFSFYSVHGIA